MVPGCICVAVDNMTPSFSSQQPSFKDVVNSAYFQRIDLSAHGFYIVPHDRCGYDYNIKIKEGTQSFTPSTYL